MVLVVVGGIIERRKREPWGGREGGRGGASGVGYERRLFGSVGTKGGTKGGRR